MNNNNNKKDNGDRDADYSIIDLDPITGRFEVVAHYY